MMMKYSKSNNQSRVFKKKPSVDRVETSQGTGRSKKYKSRKASLDTVGSPITKPYAAERIHVSTLSHSSGSQTPAQWRHRNHEKEI